MGFVQPAAWTAPSACPASARPASVCAAFLRAAALAVAACAAALLLPARAAQALAADALVLRDDLGHEVTFAHPPRRIVSLLPSVTETLCALGACGRLVATDRFSDWPPEVRALPKAGGLDDPQIETIVQLQPDLVLLSDTERISDRLHALGVATFALKSERYASIAHAVTTLGEILGERERAAQLERRIEAEVKALSVQAKSRQHGAAPSVYFEVDRTPYAAGPASFIGELLALLGARNIVSADLGPFPRLNPEFIVRHNPDVIIASPADAASLADRPGWSEILAVRQGRICSFPPQVQDTVVRPGPRVAEGMRAIADCLEKEAP